MKSLLLTLLLISATAQVNAQSAPPADAHKRPRLELQTRYNLNLLSLLLPFSATKTIVFRPDTSRNFRDVGFWGRNLRPYLKHDRRALSALNKQPWMKVGGPVLAVSGFLTMAYVFFANATTGFTPAHSFLMGAGAVGSVAGIVLHIKADGQIYRAVDIYNQNLLSARNRR